MVAEERVWNAISHVKRREILDLLLTTGSLAVGDIAAGAQLTYPATSQHLAVLHRAGLVVPTAVGRKRCYRAELAPLAEVASWLTVTVATWQGLTGRLAIYLDQRHPDPHQEDE
ncbi:DNA-binding transcriptional ArsR family regulator [Microbacterium sp. AK009]|uniref:ArsR/SmtB family transcription factor n=1 Tax=Microbacterium sp. AK009 TaxID=2723068 RepID=UPI0015CAE53C|nr:metalloregulator ArsR/SmtB family transcription factor [Microbacterium sp. AK009]NYF16538.1 DNA-binding transcriptional ArsR family regulator [Microbacterium sp. AK009]